MNPLKRILFLGVFLFISLFSNSLSAQTTANIDTPKEIPSISFTVEDIQKVKTLIEHQLRRSISDQEFEAFGNATKENLLLFQMIDKNLKNDSFFSQPHITYLIESMEDRLGLSKPTPKNEVPESNKKIKM